jgi:long-chain acyl-CoA synthetase
LDKVWLKEYPPGVPAEVDLHAYASLSELLERSCQRFSALPAYTSMGVSLSYRALEQASGAFAAYLRQQGLKKGDRLALMMPNLLQYPVALFGALRAGLTVVNVNPLYTERELEHQLDDSGATAIVVLQNVAVTLARVIAKTKLKLVIATEVGDLFPAPKRLLVNFTVKHLKHMVPSWHIPGAVTFRDALRAGRSQPPQPDAALSPDDIAFLQYTGGTTGPAKGVILTHGNVLANVQQMGAWVARDLQEGKEIAIIPLPLYHVYALTSTLIFNQLGAQCVLIANPRDMPSFLKTLRKTKPSAMIGVNTLFNALLSAPEFSKLDLRTLKLCSAGGMAVQRAVAEKWKAVTGVPLIEGYGLSETSPVVFSNRLDIHDWSGFLGLPIPSTEAAILDDQGRPLPPGEVGEICVRGPQVMKAYWNRPEDTAEAFTRDGWFRTGDMGVMDERGYFKITDRKKDMIIVSGFKVFPNEIEDVVMMHPAVLEVGAVGVFDERSGESVKLIVVKRDATLSEQALLAHCRQHLTGYKIPKLIEFRREPLPKSAIGKILRRQLRSPVPLQARSA